MVDGLREQGGGAVEAPEALGCFMIVVTVGAITWLSLYEGGRVKDEGR